MECEHDWIEIMGGDAICQHCSAAATLTPSGIWMVTEPVPMTDDRPRDDDPVVIDREWWVEHLAEAEHTTRLMYEGAGPEPPLEQACALANGTLLLASVMPYLAPDQGRPERAHKMLWKQLFGLREKAKKAYAGETVCQTEIEAARFVTDCFVPMGEHAEDALDAIKMSLGAILLSVRYTAMGPFRWKTWAPDVWVLAATAWHTLPQSMNMAEPQPFYVTPDEDLINSAWLKDLTNRFGGDAVNPN